MNIDALLTVLLDWGCGQPSIRAVMLAGSYARETARADSDIDVLFLVQDPAVFRPAHWLSQIRWADLDEGVVRWKDCTYGAVWSRHIILTGGLEVEASFAHLDWANLNPVDEGTRRVMHDGHRILYDPDARLAKLAAAITR
jgi:hypothetical protein